MPRQANGTYLAPANTAAVSGNSISSVAFNTLETDVGTEITNSLDRQGRSAMQAALPMGGFGITGLATPVNPTDATTKAYVDAAIWSTGDLKPTLKIVSDTGWVLLDDGTFGSAGSGASSRANSDTQSLFNLFFNNITDADCPIITSGGGATTRAAQTNAATAWAANCRMALPRALGRAMGVAGAGTGLTARRVGQSVGSETSTLVTANLPPYTPSGSVTVLSVLTDWLRGGISDNYSSVGGFGTYNSPTKAQMSSTGSLTGTAQGGTSTPVSIVQPETFVNWMVKL